MALPVRGARQLQGYRWHGTARFTASYSFCSRFPGTEPSQRARIQWRQGGPLGFFKGVRLPSAPPKLPTLRFRGKISLGFAVVLAISAISMGFAYLGFGRFGWCRRLPGERLGIRSGPEYRPRTDLLPVAGAIL